MQKILLLLSLLYFASSATLYCESHKLDELPTDKDDCFDREIETPAKYAQCCFVHLKVAGQDVNVCCPADKNGKKDSIKNLIKDYASQSDLIKGYEFKDYTCPKSNSSSYIKVGLLLLTLLLF